MHCMYLSVAVLRYRSEGRARHLQQILEGSVALQQHQQHQQADTA